MNFGLKIRKSEMLIFLLLLPLYRPPYLAIAKFSYMDAFFVYGKIVSFVIAILIFGSKIQKNIRKRRSLEIAVYLAFFVWLFVCGVANNNMAEIGSAFLPIITVIILFMSYLNEDVTKVLNPLGFILYIYVVINFATVLLFPHGLYSDSVNEMSTRIEYSWFLGYRNPQVRVLLPAVSISFILDIVKYERVKLKSLFLLLISIITIVLIKSSTALIGFSVFIMIYIFRMKWNIRVKPIWFILYNVAFFFGIIILRLQNIFGFFIVDVLHKELTFTGRTFIWDQALLKVLRHPLIGNGTTEFPIGSYFVATHPHNFILYLLVKGGLIGFSLFAVAAILCAKRLEQNQENKIAQILIMEFCGFFSMTVTESMTEAIFFWLIIIMGICIDDIHGKEYNYDWNCNTTKG